MNTVTVPPISTASVLEQLSRILACPLFANAGRSRAMLRFVVEQSLEQRTDRLKEYTIGTEALGRPESFDPRTDPIVRAEASRLRTRLEHYYAAQGRNDPVEIVLPKGTYIPRFLDSCASSSGGTLLPVSVPALVPAMSRIYRLVALGGMGLFAVVLLWRLASHHGAIAGPPPRPVLQFTIPLPSGSYFEPPISRQAVAVSADGTRLAAIATGKDSAKVWIRELADSQFRELPGSAGAWSVFWSPDSRKLFFSVKGSLREADLDTGSSHVVAELPSHAIFGSWRSPGDVLLYVGSSTVFELDIGSGKLHRLPDRDMRWAQFLPGTDSYVHVIFNQQTAKYQAVATNERTQHSTVLMDVDSRVEYAPPRREGERGHLLFIRGGSLLAQAFDASRLSLSGDPFPIAQNVIYFRPSAAASFSVSDTGLLVYQANFPSSELRWYDRDGRVVTFGHVGPFAGSFRLSPGGTRVAATLWNGESGGGDVWIFQESGAETRRVTSPPASGFRPVWSPDGKRIAFASSLSGPPFLAFSSTAEGGEEQRFDQAPRAAEPGDLQLPTDWSRDGRLIAYDTGIGEDRREVWIADVALGTAVPLLHGVSSQWGAVFSPDGTQIAFISDESGHPEAYIQAFASQPGLHMLGDRHQVSQDGAWMVRWRPDGHELFYAGLDSRLFVRGVEHGMVQGESKPLFQLPGNPQYGTATDFQFDVEPGGQRFVMTTSAAVSPPPLTVIENWQDKFQRQ